MRLETLEERDILNGRARRKQLRMWFRADNTGPKIDWILFIPNAAPRPVPAYIGLNYYGNQELDPDPAIRLTEGWLRNNDKHFIFFLLPNLLCITRFCNGFCDYSGGV